MEEFQQIFVFNKMEEMLRYMIGIGNDCIQYTEQLLPDWYH